MKTTTLVEIRMYRPCTSSWEELLAGLGKTRADDEPLPLSEIQRILSTEDALWATRTQDPALVKDLMCRYAEAVVHLSTDPRVAKAVEEARAILNGGTKDFAAQVLQDVRIAEADAWNREAALEAGREAALAAREAKVAVIVKATLRRAMWNGREFNSNGLAWEASDVAGEARRLVPGDTFEFETRVFLEWANS